MKNLHEASGLDIKLENNHLIYDERLFPVEPKSRTYEEAKDVYLEKSAPKQELYFMYRYFEKESDADLFENNRCEYDITVLKTGKVGPEPIKTVGHYHAEVPGTEISYPEVYEVITGEITYLLQTKPNADNEVDVVIVEAKAGDKVIVPPNYGHISINRGAETAVSSNIQRRDLPASADYDAFSEKNGGALYFDGSDWTENYNYTVRSKRIVRPKPKPEWGIVADKPLYTSFVENPEKFTWLTEPQRYNFDNIWK
jgi:glucose-6-phosphate isomerase